MQMLSAGGLAILTDGLRSPDEDNPRGYFELEAVKATPTDRSWLQNAPGKAVKVIHLLLADLPAEYEYRVLFMQRPLDQILRSQKAMLSRSGRRGPASDQQLTKVFTRQVVQVRAWLDLQSNFRVLEVEYDDCLREPFAAAARVNAFLGGTLDERAMAAAAEQGLRRQR